MMTTDCILVISIFIDPQRIEIGLEDILMIQLFSVISSVIWSLLGCQSKEEVTHGAICRISLF